MGRSIESSLSQARHGEINNRARKTERISVMDRGRGQARGGTLKGAGREVRGRDEGVKGVRKKFLTQRTQRSERMKEFLFMNEIVTGGVGQMRTYGPRGQGGGRLGIKGLRD